MWNVSSSSETWSRGETRAIASTISPPRNESCRPSGTGRPSAER